MIRKTDTESRAGRMSDRKDYSDVTLRILMGPELRNPRQKGTGTKKIDILDLWVI